MISDKNVNVRKYVGNTLFSNKNNEYEQSDISCVVIATNIFLL